MVVRGLVPTRSQAENYINLGYVQVNGKMASKSGVTVKPQDKVKLNLEEQYVSRAALKLASTADKFGLDFRSKAVLDVGSSTGGFTDYALRHGAKQVVAVDVGTNQMHSSIRNNPKVELYEQTDIRQFQPKLVPQIVLVDVSFIGLRAVLPQIAKLSNAETQIVVLLKPQFEAGKETLNKGVIKNNKLRRQVLKDFEDWSKKLFLIKDKADSEVSGSHGNLERFYLLQNQR